MWLHLSYILSMVVDDFGLELEIKMTKKWMLQGLNSTLLFGFLTRAKRPQTGELNEKNVTKRV